MDELDAALTWLALLHAGYEGNPKESLRRALVDQIDHVAQLMKDAGFGEYVLVDEDVQ